jgi:HEAT repeat protein
MKNLWPVCLVVLLPGCGREKSAGDWVAQLKDPDASLRLQAVKALAEQGTEPGVVQALADSLKEENAFVRRDAAHALARIGPAARPAVPALVAALKDREPSVRKATAGALKKIDPEAAAKKGIR